MKHKYLITLLALPAFLASTASAGLPFNTGYTFTAGSDDYYSHSLSADTTLYDKAKNNSLTATLALFSDVEYSYIGSMVLKGKTGIGKEMKAGLLLGVSGGNQKSGGSPVSSRSWGLLLDKGFTDIMAASLEYVNTRGSIYSQIYRDALIQSGKLQGNARGRGKTATTTTTVQVAETVVSEYSSDTVSLALDADLDAVISRLSAYAALSLSQSSEDIRVTTYGFSLSYRLSDNTSVSGSFTTAGDSLGQTKAFYGLGINRSF